MQDLFENPSAEGARKRPGRPALNGAPLTAAERQKAYRRRIRENLSIAATTPSLASRPELFRELNSQLALLDADFDRPHVRSVCNSIVKEIVTRYQLSV